MHARLSLALAAVASLVLALPAHAETKTISCSDKPDGPEFFRFKVDYDRSLVIWPQIGGASEFSARVTNETVIWERPRYEPGDGTVSLRAQYALDRLNGQLRASFYCEDRDADICSPGSFHYCKAVSDRPIL